MPDANEVMQLLLKTQTEMEELEADDPQVCFDQCSSCLKKFNVECLSGKCALLQLVSSQEVFPVACSSCSLDCVTHPVMP